MVRRPVSTPPASILSSRSTSHTPASNAHYRPHAHAGLTTHLILSGSFTVAYPADGAAQETFGPGARIDVPAEKVHEVWMGGEGCTYVIGE
jgi:hypothetical protein